LVDSGDVNAQASSCEGRLPLLLEGWETIREEFWVKDENNRWVCVEKNIALRKEPIERCYGLGLFVLQKGPIYE